MIIPARYKHTNAKVFKGKILYQVIFICLKMLEAKPGFIINCVNVLWLKRFIY